MKNIIIVLLFMPLLSFGQWFQLGNSVEGEEINDQFGTSVSINADGNIIAVGAPYNDGNGNASGHVKVFENLEGTWVQLGANIEGTDPADRSGHSVSLNNEGNILAIGAPDNNENQFESGQVRVFEYLLGNWTQIGDDIIGEAISDHSGLSISLNGDGTILAIGAPDNEGSEGGNFGHVRVYENLEGTWDQIGNDIDGEFAEDNSGFAVDINEDGSIVAIGAPMNDDTDTDAGQVRVYENQAGVWTQLGNDIDGEALHDQFGYSVSLSADGTIVAIGAINHNGIGNVRIFENQLDNWVQVGDNIEGDANNDRFGASVSLSADGTIVGIGAPLNNNTASDSGQVKIYQNQSGTWTQIDNSIEGAVNGDRLGFSLDLSNDGTSAVIGAYLNDDNGQNSGQAKVYTNSTILNNHDNNFENSVFIYTNPVTSQATINFKERCSAINLKIFNTVGQEILSEKYTNVIYINLSTSDYPDGLYFVNIQCEDLKGVLKFIKS